VVSEASSVNLAFDGTPDGLAAALDGHSASSISNNGARWEVSLADDLVRYLVIGWPPGLRGGVEREAFIAHRFREVHGIFAPEWRITIERTATRIPAIACAAPAAIVDAVKDWAQRNRFRLTGLGGDFVTVFNRVRPQLVQSVGALALSRGGRLTVGIWHDGIWHALRSQPDGVAKESGFGAFFRLIGAPQGEGAGVGVLYCVGDSIDAPDGWRVKRVEDREWA
jgi:hypothetical protein